MKIAHISDIHYRPLSRHAEYRQVFSSFAESCWQKSVEAIVVVGDIYHCKTTGITAEYIDELSWWVRTLASVAPLHLTLGNHDFNLSNKSRQDAVSPIISSLSNDASIENPVRLYKESGVYPLDKSTNLCVYSLFDEHKWDNVKPEPGKKNVAIYHGPVDKAVTETGWRLTSGVSTDMFKSYDVCLLGDIHKQQFLGYREQGDQQVPWIGYPGSTVQQNYAEDLDHGYLLWDLKERGHRVEFVKLPNPKPFVTVAWDGKIDAVSIPDGARVKVKHQGPLSQHDIRRAVEHFKDKFSAAEVIFSADRYETSQEIVRRSAHVKQNLHDVDTLMGLLEKHSNFSSFAGIDWNEARAAVTSYIANLAPDEQVSSRNTKWSIKDLKFDNILGYGEGNSVKFSDLEGLVGVFGPNRVGKSSIIAALTYCLFNSSDRGPLKNLQFVNVRKPHAYARAVISIGNDDYVVERQTVRQQNKKDETGVTSVNFYKMVDGEAVDLNGEQRSDTDKLIRSLIGSSDDFMMMSLSTQGDIDRFIREGSSHRKQVLTRFLDLDFMDRLLEQAKSDAASLKADAKAASPPTPEDLQKIVLSKDEVQGSLDKLNILKATLAGRLASAQKRLSSIESTAEGYRQRKEKEEKVGRIALAIQSLNSDVIALQEQMLQEEAAVAAAESLASSCDPGALADVMRQISEAKDLIRAREKEHDRQASLLTSAKKSVKVLQDVPCGDSYPACRFIKDAHESNAALPAIEADLTAAAVALADARFALGKFDEESARSEGQRLRDAATLAEQHRKKLDDLRRRLVDAESKLASLSGAKEALQDSISSLPESAPKDYEDLVLDVESLEGELRSADAKIADALRQLGAVNEKIDQAIKSRQKLESVLARLKVYEFLSHAFSKKGIPASVLSEQLPILNQEISAILSGVVDFNIELECEPGSSSLEVYINYGDSRRAIELCSGMEKMVASLAIRIALTNVSTVPRSDIMVIDEGFGALDEINIDAVKRLLVAAKRYFKSIIIISHVPAIKDVADFVLEVRRNEKDSKITH